MEFKEIIEKEREIFRKTTWYNLMRGFIESREFEKPFADACHVLNNNEHFYPRLSAVFMPFQYTDVYNCKAIIFNSWYNMDYMTNNNGLAYGYWSTGKSPYDELKNFIKKNYGMCKKQPTKGLEMTEYAKQGVLLLNNCPIIHDDIKLCQRLWEPFYDYFFDMIDKNIVRVSIGETKDYNFDKKFNSIFSKKNGSVFDFINEVLKEKNQKEIVW